MYFGFGSHEKLLRLAVDFSIAKPQIQDPEQVIEIYKKFRDQIFAEAKADDEPQQAD